MAGVLNGRRGRPRDQQLTERRREEILDVAAKVFAEYGYPRTDVQVIADRVGVGKGTIYRYFPTKQELFLAAVDRGMSRLRAELDAVIHEGLDPLELIAKGIRTYLAFFDTHPEHVELIIQERAEFKDRKKPTYFERGEASVEKWVSLLRELITEGRVRQIPVERVREVVGDLLYGTMFTNYFAGRRDSLEKQSQDIVDIVFHGILRDGQAQG